LKRKRNKKAKRISFFIPSAVEGSHRKLVVEGFRQSTDAVAAFRFGPVRESYAAEKYHNTRNVGVIGIALFMKWAPTRGPAKKCAVA